MIEQQQQQKQKPERIPRHEYRYCRLCHKRGRNTSLIRPCDCLITNYVHVNCLAEHMLSNDRIHCDQCSGQYRGIRYSYTRKSFFEWLWKESTARNSLLSCISLLCSIQVCLYSLWQTLFTDELEDFVDDITDIDFNLTSDAIKHNMGIIMIIQVKIVLPVLSIICAIKQPITVWNDYHKYCQNHYNIYIDEALTASHQPHQQQQQQQ
ncbi:hypothetical protein DERP_008000 [Dermatophagoides pteronyssinus]|uniref:RING-CH-type domain-containing protein n=1 Tax=Dermatophagoides pteronyssinus TaxID=6956 RepID=A0ABQ8ITG3_DERPT|nr:hypothetical protein DERP_008000 [Dermatophagoides pteronyssinus]